MSCNTVSIFPKVQSHYVSKILISQILNCGVGKDSWECLGLQGDRPWIFIGRTDADSETLILWLPDMKNWPTGNDPDAGKVWGRRRRLMIDDRGWNGWITPQTQWTWVWVSSGSWWWPTKPGVLQSMRLWSNISLLRLRGTISMEASWFHALLICAAAAAKSLQSCPTLCDPIDGSPPGSAVSGILQARTLEWVLICEVSRIKAGWGCEDPFSGKRNFWSVTQVL